MKMVASGGMKEEGGNMESICCTSYEMYNFWESEGYGGGCGGVFRNHLVFFGVDHLELGQLQYFVSQW